MSPSIYRLKVLILSQILIAVVISFALVSPARSDDEMFPENPEGSSGERSAQGVAAAAELGIGVGAIRVSTGPSTAGQRIMRQETEGQVRALEAAAAQREQKFTFDEVVRQNFEVKAELKPIDDALRNADRETLALADRLRDETARLEAARTRTPAQSKGVADLDAAIARLETQIAQWQPSAQRFLRLKVEELRIQLAKTAVGQGEVRVQALRTHFRNMGVSAEFVITPGLNPTEDLRVLDAQAERVSQEIRSLESTFSRSDRALLEEMNARLTATRYARERAWRYAQSEIDADLKAQMDQIALDRQKQGFVRERIANLEVRRHEVLARNQRLIAESVVSKEARAAELSRNVEAVRARLAEAAPYGGSAREILAAYDADKLALTEAELSRLRWNASSLRVVRGLGILGGAYLLGDAIVRAGLVFTDRDPGLSPAGELLYRAVADRSSSDKKPAGVEPPPSESVAPVGTVR